MFKILSHKKNCNAHRCTNEKAKKDRFCSKHRKRYTKEIDPEAYHFEILRSNAKRRKKEFGLTLEEFRKFCSETNYMQLKGRSKNSASIDRKDQNRGYFYDNLQILTVSENSSKYHYDRKNNVQDDLPF